MVGSNILKPSNELLANFDYKDLIRGNAYVTYYAGSAFNSGATESPVLFVETFRSKEETNNVSLAKSLSNAVRIDEDYDIEVAQTQIMKGKALVECKITTSAVGASSGITAYLKAILRKYDGTTETDIGYALSGSTTQSGDGTTTKEYTLVIDIPNAVRVNAGETLRFTMQLWASTAGGVGSRGAGYYTDPTDTSNHLKVDIPFKVLNL